MMTSKQPKSSFVMAIRPFTWYEFSSDEDQRIRVEQECSGV